MKLTKTLITTLLLVAIAVASVTGIVHYTTPDAVAASNILGDVDEDGKVEASDARLALRYAINLETANNAQKDRADWNKDGTVTVEDARMILRCSVGLETQISLGDRYYIGINEWPYEEIPEGIEYIVVHPDGSRETIKKPVTHPVTPYDGICSYCGKNELDVNGEEACAHGGCTRWMMDMTCRHCGVFVPAGKCHTCKK